jgi:hypothetical protein
MAEAIYILCALLSAACAGLLLRQHRVSPTGLTLWTGVGFAGLALSNALLVADLVIFPTGIDLALLRSSVALLSILTILVSFIWETH